MIPAARRLPPAAALAALLLLCPPCGCRSSRKHRGRGDDSIDPSHPPQRRAPSVAEVLARLRQLGVSEAAIGTAQAEAAQDSDAQRAALLALLPPPPPQPDPRDHFSSSCPVSFSRCEADAACEPRLQQVLSQPGWRPPHTWAPHEPETFMLLVDCVAGRMEDTAVEDLESATCPYPAPPPRRHRPVLGGVDVVAYFEAGRPPWRQRQADVVPATSGRFAFNLTTFDYT